MLDRSWDLKKEEEKKLQCEQCKQSTRWSSGLQLLVLPMGNCCRVLEEVYSAEMQSPLLYVYLQIPFVLFPPHMFFIQFPLSSLLFIPSSPKSWQSKSFQAELQNKVRTQWNESNSPWQDSFQSMVISVLSCVKDTWHACMPLLSRAGEISLQSS